MHIIRPADFRSQPWKNGGGVTFEIVRWPKIERYDVRISIAECRGSGPFSRFPGYRRWSFLAGSAPIMLDIAGVPHELTGLGDHVEVDGDLPISCTLPAGPSHLLNFLVRDQVNAHVGCGPCALPLRFVFALAALPGLPERHAGIFDPPAPATLTRPAVWLR